MTQTTWCPIHKRIEDIVEAALVRGVGIHQAIVVDTTLRCGARKHIVMSPANFHVTLATCRREVAYEAH
jgi:hypothetical protein